MYQLQKSKVKCWPLYDAHIEYSHGEMSALTSAHRTYTQINQWKHLWVFLLLLIFCFYL